MKNNIKKNVESKVDESTKNDIEKNSGKKIVKVEDKFKWIKDHKKFVIGFVTAGAAIGGGIATVMNKEKIGERVFKIVDVLSKNINGNVNVSKTIESVPKCIKSVKNIYDGRLPKSVKKLISGKTLNTATELGNAMGLSAQVIHKKLIEHGLLERVASGVLYLTEAGKKYGQDGQRCMKSGYVANVDEWKPEVLKVIFDKDDFDRRIDVEKLIEHCLLKKNKKS